MEVNVWMVIQSSCDHLPEKTLYAASHDVSDQPVTFLENDISLFVVRYSIGNQKLVEKLLS